MKNLLFKETLWVNVLRSFCAGIVWAVISLFMANDGHPFYFKLIFPFVMPLLLGAFYIVSLILKMFNLAGIGNIMCMLVSVPGDPIVFLLHNLKPELVPVKEYKFLWFVGIILVYDDEIKLKPKTKDESSTLIYAPFLGSSLIAKVNVDGSVYDISGSYVGHYENKFVYRGASGGTVLARYDEDGKIYEGMNSFEKLGEVSSDGIIYDNGLFGKGNPIAKVEGSNKYVAAAVYFGLFR